VWEKVGYSQSRYDDDQRLQKSCASLGVSCQGRDKYVSMDGWTDGFLELHTQVLLQVSGLYEQETIHHE
jgi:hypothetical protein